MQQEASAKSLEWIAANHQDARTKSPIIRVTSSTYHLSQVALRELRRQIRLELPDFQQENLLVELGPYGSFDVRIGDSLVCQTSKTVQYPRIHYIVEQLGRAINLSTTDELMDLLPSKNSKDKSSSTDSDSNHGSSSASSASTVRSVSLYLPSEDRESILQDGGYLALEDVAPNQTDLQMPAVGGIVEVQGLGADNLLTWQG